MEEFIHSLEKLTGLPALIVFKVALSIFVVVFIQVLRFAIIRYVSTHDKDRETVYRWRKTTSYFSAIFYILVLGRIWFDAFSSISTFLGLASAGIAIAMRDPLVSIAGWFYIFSRRPFRLGDRVEINGRAGDVIDQKIFTFTILEIGEWVDADQSTGREILVPNSFVFTHPVTNFTLEFPYIWNELQLALTFESAWERARDILQEVAEEVSRETTEKARQELDQKEKDSLIMYRKLTPIVYVTVKGNGIILSLRYLSPARSRRGFQHAIWTEVLQRFAKEPEIAFSYETMRLTREGGRVSGPGEVD